MLLRQVGHSGLRVSRMALGTMSWGAGVDDYEAAEQLTTFVDAGGTLVDTAPIYGDGACEELLGRVLASTGTRDRVVLAGKCALTRRDGEVVRDASRGTVLDQLDLSLRQLGTDHLDLWQVHRWDDSTPLDETLAALEHAVTSGRVRYVGISNFTGWQTALGHATLAGRPARVPLVSTQVEYSLLRREAEVDVVPALQHLGMGLIAWSPLGRGVLTGKYRNGTPADSRGADPRWEQFVAPYLTPDRAGVVEALARAAEGLGASPAQIALAWVRDRPAVASVVVGARTTAQLVETLAAEAVEVPPEIRQALTDVSGGEALSSAEKE
ncbi:oxidoreductase, aldo/keto reductase family protein [Aeromicrobium marinum DSM 15272]|uniref:Oxidoreductase, aldo/keto reductase family protein n=1 Tax=Aeromicrobium marinum DSM 15272 TaxID=585531 RepID=E2S9X8_9ACTN|nr:aldo/keto reductase [Aeromicrobium marinum]EFQ84052.1 oxidoreductase, aldo/keto reductase family protein [Aeromicrobium marinum DSM 15272]